MARTLDRDQHLKSSFLLLSHKTQRSQKMKTARKEFSSSTLRTPIEALGDYKG